MSVVVSAIAVLALFVLALGPLDDALHGVFLWMLNLFTSLPGGTSWVLGSLLYRLMFGAVVGGAIGIPIGYVLGRGRSAPRVAFLALLPSVVLTGWLTWPDPWLILSLVVTTCIAPAAAWWSSGLRRQRGP